MAKRRRKAQQQGDEAIITLALMGGTFVFYQLYQPIFASETTTNQLFKAGGLAFGTTVVILFALAIAFGHNRSVFQRQLRTSAHSGN